MKKHINFILILIISALLCSCSTKEYEIFFDSMGGSQVDSILKEYKSGISDLPIPNKLNQHFMGWYLDESFEEELSYDFMTNFDLKLYAKWDYIEGLEYEIQNNEVVITNYFGNKDDLYIPMGIEGYSVTTIGNNAFSFVNLQNVKIPQSVTRIEAYAFAATGLTIVTIPKGLVIIGEGAFDWAKIESFNIGSNKNFVYENNLLLTYDENTLIAGIGYLTNVTIPNSVTKIEGYAFAFNNLTTITIPKNVTDIGDFAFFSNKLTSINILGDQTRFNNIWNDIGFPYNLMTHS